MFVFRNSQKNKFENSQDRKNSHVEPLDLLKLLPEREQINLKCIGLQPVMIVELPIDFMQMQYRHELPLDRFFVDEAGNVNRSIMNSPIYNLLEIYRSKGKRYIKRNLRQLEYYKMFKSFGEVGFRYDWYREKTRIDFKWSDEKIRGKIENFISLYKSVRRWGYRGRKFNQFFITVLDMPFEVSRHGLEFENWQPFEIWGGHHRAAVLAALGFQNAHVILLTDQNPSLRNYDQIMDEIKNILNIKILCKGSFEEA